jgi:hypothetical protein
MTLKLFHSHSLPGRRHPRRPSRDPGGPPSLAAAGKPVKPVPTARLYSLLLPSSYWREHP